MDLLLLFVPVTAISLTIAVVVGAFGYESAARVSEAVCARCRYPTQGLTSQVCPECGADLAGFGTLRPDVRRCIRPPIWVAALCRTILIGVPAALFFFPMRQEFPRAVSSADATASSRAGLFTSIHVAGTGSADTNDTVRHDMVNPRTRCRARLDGPSGTVTLRVKDAAVRIEYDGPNRRRFVTLDGMTEEDVLKWMQAAGVNTAHAAARDEAKAIMNLIRAVVVGGIMAPEGLGPGTFNCSRGMTMQPRALTAYLIAVALAWLCLLWSLRSWRRSATVPSPGSSSPPSAPRRSL